MPCHMVNWLFFVFLSLILTYNKVTFILLSKKFTFIKEGQAVFSQKKKKERLSQCYFHGVTFERTADFSVVDNSGLRDKSQHIHSISRVLKKW